MAIKKIEEIDCVINGIDPKYIGYTVQQYNKEMRQKCKESDREYLNRFLQFMDMRSFEELINLAFDHPEYRPKSHSKALNKELIKRYRELIKQYK